MRRWNASCESMAGERKNRHSPSQKSNQNALPFA
jgi:hypothetical protein